MSTVDTKGKYGRYIHNIIGVTDFVIVNIAFFITLLLIDRFSLLPRREFLLAVNLAYIPVALIFSRFHKTRSLHMESVVRNAILAVLLHLVFFLVVLFLLKVEDIDDRFFYTYYPILAVMMIIWWVTARKILKHYRKHGRNFTRVIIVGTGPTAIRLYEEMKSDEGFGYSFRGFFDDNPSANIPQGAHLGTLDDVETFVRDNRIDEIYYTLSGERNETLRKVINAADNNVARFYYVPQINRYINRGFQLQSLGSVPVLTIMNQPLEHLSNRIMKRSFDIAFSSVVLLFSPLVFIPVAIAIKMSSPGPIFFKQLRTGYKGRDFYCWKFRTMRVNADADKKQAERNDPRKTKVGNFLRKTSIDELPQFINVIKGDMSIVGPRPHMLKHTEEYRRLIDQYMVRHFIKPGITGWAQVEGYRGQTEELWQMEKRVEHDVWYIKHWSFLLDIKIIYKTVTNAIRGEKNAF